MGTHKSLKDALDKGLEGRRNFLKTAMGAVLMPYLPLLRKKTEAERFLEEFHANIPSVGSVMRYNVNGAKHCLVHVKQMHYADGIDDKLLEKVNAVQHDIYPTLSLMVDNYGLRKVYREGVTKETINTYKEGVNQIAQIKKLEIEILESIEDSQRMRDSLFDNEKEKYTSTINERVQEGEKVLSDCRKLYKKLKTDAGYFEAIGKLFMEGKIDIEAAEKDHTLNAALEAYKNKDPTKDELDENREDALLELVYQNKDPVAVTVYGGRHYFIDNIEKWNKLHPKDKFCLVIVNPNAYIQYGRKSFGLNSNAEEPVSGKRAILEKK